MKMDGCLDGEARRGAIAGGAGEGLPIAISQWPLAALRSAMQRARGR